MAPREQSLPLIEVQPPHSNIQTPTLVSTRPGFFLTHGSAVMGSIRLRCSAYFKSLTCSCRTKTTTWSKSFLCECLTTEHMHAQHSMLSASTPSMLTRFLRRYQYYSQSNHSQGSLHPLKAALLISCQRRQIVTGHWGSHLLRW